MKQEPKGGHPQKAVQAAREAYLSHHDYCTICDAQTGIQCPRGAQLWRRVAVAIRRAGGPSRVNVARYPSRVTQSRTQTPELPRLKDYL